VSALSKRRCWQGLSRHHEDVKDLHLRDLFASDPARGERLVAEGAGLYLDYSKNRITDETIQLLGALAEQSGLGDRIEAMFPRRQDHPRAPDRDRTAAGARQLHQRADPPLPHDAHDESRGK
jgi:hypothetical protein